MQIECTGVQTHYQQIGTGTPLILLHGWGGSWESWHPIITQLSNDFQLIIPDLPAFGKSAEPLTVWDSADYANWLTNTLKKRYHLRAVNSQASSLKDTGCKDQAF
jgi:pimeloyl-ACP methyl ester carboxylesterase